MTADERIENLLNAFGQTINDLPKAEAPMYAYSREHLGSAILAACRWRGNQSLSTSLDCEDYICHLCDVIDRMETALATARRMMGCRGCKDYGGVFGRACKKFNREGACFVVNDAFLMGGDD